MTELSYRWSAGKFLDSNEIGCGLLVALWLMLYLALIATTLNMRAIRA